MRHALLSFAILSLVASSAATADPIRERCRPFGQYPANARNDVPKFEAMIAIAQCRAEQSMETVEIRPNIDGVLALDAAVQPAMQLLDVVIEHGDLAHRMIAAHAKGALYDAMTVRVRSSIPMFVGKPSDRRFAEYHAKIHEADAVVQPWIDLADDSYAEVSRLAKDDPALLVENQVLANIVYDSRLQRAAIIATR
jgi:hypothetical protein